MADMSPTDEAIIFGHELEFVEPDVARAMIGAKLEEIRLRRLEEGADRG